MGAPVAYGQVTNEYTGRQRIGADDVLLALDAHLFTPGAWFAIDTANNKVPGVRPGTLENALHLVGRGTVATIVGELRPEARAVDVDLTDDMAFHAVETISDWCRARNLWFLVRPSGGAHGRAHVLIITGVHTSDLERLLQQMRTEQRLTQVKLNMRTKVRPLSAPHRRHGHIPAPLDAAQRLADLTQLLTPTALAPLTTHKQPVKATRARKRTRSQDDQTPSPVVPEVPLARRRRALPPAWETYLRAGRCAARSVDRSPSERSLIEAEATFHMVICGYSEPEAWNAITTAHPSAFVKARERGRHWWWFVWNRAVIDADTWLRENRATTPSLNTLTETTTARTDVEQTWLTWPKSTRHTDYEVAHAILERMDAHQTTDLPIAERELLLHTTLSTRPTLRAALSRLQHANFITITPTFVPGTPDTSNTIHLVKNTPLETDTTPVSPTDPQQLHTPRLPLPLRLALGPLHTHTLQALSLTHPAGQALPSLVRALGLLDDPYDEPTARQYRTVLRHLTQLATYGLAQVDEHGHWHPTNPGQTTNALADLELIGLRRFRHKAESIAIERANYHQALQDQERKRHWINNRDEQAQQHLARQHHAQTTWWNNLDPHERAARSSYYATRFAALPLDTRATLKTTWAQTRARAGITEQEHHRVWLTSLSPTELERRSQEHALQFALMPKYAQDQHVQALHAHRTRWNLPGPGRDLNAGNSAHSPEAPPSPPSTPEPRYHQPELANLNDLLHLANAMA